MVSQRKRLTDAAARPAAARKRGGVQAGSAIALRLASSDPVRVLIFDTYYPAFLRTHYAERPGLSERPYDEQLESLLSRFFGTSDAYSHHLRELGHEAWEAVPNCEPLQRAWMREHGRALRTLSLAAARAPGRLRAAAGLLLQRQIAAAQIEALQPEVVYCQDLWFFSPSDLRRIRGEGRLVVGQIASQPPGPDVLRSYDLMMTSFPHYVARFRKLGVDSEYLKIGFYERVLERVDTSVPRSHPLVFAGGLNPAVHPSGVELVNRLAAALPIEVWGYGAGQLAQDSPARSRWRGEAWGLDMYSVLARSKIVVNRHIEAAEGFTNNMRLYETTGMGALLLTEAAPNLSELFEPDREVVAYDSLDDLIEKARHFMAHEDEAAAIAGAGHARTMRDHTYAQIIRELVPMLEARLP